MEKIYPMQNIARKIGKWIQNTGPKCFAPFLITAMITFEEFRIAKQLVVSGLVEKLNKCSEVKPARPLILDSPWFV
jgi:hypothetical protein